MREREVLEEVVSDDSANWLPAAAATSTEGFPHIRRQYIFPPSALLIPWMLKQKLCLFCLAAQ